MHYCSSSYNDCRKLFSVVEEFKRREEYVAANRHKSVANIHDADLVSGTSGPQNREEPFLSHCFARMNESSAKDEREAAMQFRNGAFSPRQQRCSLCEPNAKLGDVFIDLQVEPVTAAGAKPLYVRCRANTTVAQLAVGITQEMLGDDAASNRIALYCEDEPLDDGTLTLFDCWCERWFGNVSLLFLTAFFGSTVIFCLNFSRIFRKRSEIHCHSELIQ